MNPENTPTQTVPVPRRRRRWIPVLCAILALGLAVETGYLIYLTIRPGLEIARAAEQAINSDALKSLDVLSMDVTEADLAAGLDPASQRDLEATAQQLGAMLGTGEDAQAIQSLVDHVLGMGSQYDDALGMADDPNVIPSPAPSANDGLLVLSETDKAYSITFDARAGAINTVNVRLEGNDLIVRAEGRHGATVADRTMTLQKPIDAESLQSTVRDGLVVITVDKAARIAGGKTA